MSATGARPPGPSEGTAWAPATSGNSLTWDGSAVVKSYGMRQASYQREKAVLRYLSATPGIRVPQIVSFDDRAAALRLRFEPGIDGAVAIEAGGAGELLSGMGRYLAQLHAIDCSGLSGTLPGAGRILVHGDFAHYNALLSEEPGELPVVLDWEGAFLGDAVLDLAWCEWQLRERYPRHGWAVRHLLEGYGDAPPAEVRQAAVEQRLLELRGGP